MVSYFIIRKYLGIVPFWGVNASIDNKLGEHDMNQTNIHVLHPIRSVY